MNSDFEKRLQQQPLRELPRDWRAEILQAAQAATERTPAPAHQPASATLIERLSALLWPCPKAWAGVAAVWVVIAALNVSVSEPEMHIAEQTSTSPVQWMMAQREQERLLSEMNHDIAPAAGPADRPRRTMPGPRSEACLSVTV